MRAYDHLSTAYIDFIAESHPAEPQYYLTRATAYIKTHQFTDALRDFDTASIKDGYEGDVDVYLQLVVDVLLTVHSDIRRVGSAPRYMMESLTAAVTDELDRSRLVWSKDAAVPQFICAAVDCRLAGEDRAEDRWLDPYFQSRLPPVR